MRKRCAAAGAAAFLAFAPAAPALAEPAPPAPVVQAQPRTAQLGHPEPERR
jgi:hypothetical protein